jgi:hypothetical protein
MKQALIIESHSPADPHNFNLIETLPLIQYDLICILGMDCSAWEELIDETLVGPERILGSLPVTTSHPGENPDEVQEIAISFFKNEKLKIERCQI